VIFTTYTFLVFFIVTLSIYAVVPIKAREFVMIAAGFVFYMYDGLGHFALLLALTLIIYGLAALRRKDALLVGISLAVATLVFYKYWKMVVITWNELFAGWFGLDLPIWRISVPLAISFFVFEFVHYLTDVYRGKTERVSFKTFLLFIFFFPSMVAGPIKRIQSFAKEQAAFRWNDLQMGLLRMGLGLFKKMVLADSLNPLFLPMFADPASFSPGMLWLAMYAYAFKIYFDFSAYSDLAIGAALCFGYHLPENFNWPYISHNLTEFWRRWHISLSTWIRDYVYIPLGGNRRGYLKMLLFIFLAMTISGLWHGANWTFVVWGMWHGVGQVVHKLYGKLRGERGLKKDGFLKENAAVNKNVFSLGLSWLITFHFVCFGWVWFASPSLHSATRFLLKMWGVA
jgi:alginate O-acetyltransferase complex protein AlgI